MDIILSVILPAYNAEKYIKNSIESVLQQSLSNFELIIINDGSNDNTENEIKKINDKRIKLINNNKNIGLQKTLNKGILYSSGRYIARIDADDRWINKDKLKNQISFLEKNKDYILVGTGAICINEQNKFLFKYLKEEQDCNIKKKILGQNCFIHSSVVFNKNKAIAAGLYSEGENEKHVEDYDLWLKFGTMGKLYNIQSYDVSYMIRNDSIGHKNLKEQLIKTLKLSIKYRKNYPKNKLINLIRNYSRLLYFGYLKK